MRLPVYECLSIIHLSHSPFITCDWADRNTEKSFMCLSMPQSKEHNFFNSVMSLHSYYDQCLSIRCCCFVCLRRRPYREKRIDRPHSPCDHYYPHLSRGW